MTIDEISLIREKLQASFDLLIAKIGEINIGTLEQFPYGWRKAAKGRTVWRIVEELITQNLEKYHSEFNIENVKASSSEVSVYDFECKFKDIDYPVYVNIKSAVEGGKVNKDDVSKAEGVINFYESGEKKCLFIASFFLIFQSNMTLKISKCVVFPICWIPDVYVNPSNNGNLQSAKCKFLESAIKRDNAEFITILKSEIEIAKQKKQKKQI